MKSWIVYEHISPSGKVYVGITSQKPQHRWKGGYGYVGSGHHPLFAKAILKYGWDNIEHKIIATDLTREEANTIEQTLISKYKREKRSYNITDGGEGGLGTKHSEETKQLLRERHIGTTRSDEAIRKTEETRLSNLPYVLVAIDPENIYTFKTAKDAAAALGINSRCNISAAIGGKQCLVNGFVFVHWDKDEPIDEEFLHALYEEKVNNRYASERRKVV